MGDVAQIAGGEDVGLEEVVEGVLAAEEGGLAFMVDPVRHRGGLFDKRCWWDGC